MGAKVLNEKEFKQEGRGTIRSEPLQHG